MWGTFSFILLYLKKMECQHLYVGSLGLCVHVVMLYECLTLNLLFKKRTMWLRDRRRHGGSPWGGGSQLPLKMVAAAAEAVAGKSREVTGVGPEAASLWEPSAFQGGSNSSS